MTTAQTIIDAARSQIGVRFKHQGRCAGLALDCAGLGAHVAQAIGANYNEWPGYGRLPHEGLLESVLDKQPCLEIVTDKQPGDLLLMRFGRDPQHIAIYTENNTIIHSFEAVGMVCEHTLDHVWEQRIVRIYRFTSASLSASRSTPLTASTSASLSASSVVEP